MNNQELGSKRVSVVIGLVILSIILAVCGIYPSNYESIFTPINYGLYGFIWICVIISRIS